MARGCNCRCGTDARHGRPRADHGPRTGCDGSRAVGDQEPRPLLRSRRVPGPSLRGRRSRRGRGVSARMPRPHRRGARRHRPGAGGARPTLRARHPGRAPVRSRIGRHRTRQRPARAARRGALGDRRPHAAIQLALSLAGPPPRDQACVAQWTSAVAPVHRPRRLQGHQRQPRAPVRQPRARGGRERHPPECARDRRGRAVRRRRVRVDSARYRQRRRVRRRRTHTRADCGAWISARRRSRHSSHRVHRGGDAARCGGIRRRPDPGGRRGHVSRQGSREKRDFRSRRIGATLSLRSLFSLFSSDLAIDLGTANTCVYARGKGIVVNEPSIVAINKVNGRIEAVGKDAKEMLGRTPGNIVAIKPMKDGVIADFEVTEKMLTYFIKKAHNRNVWVRPRIVIGVPSEITQLEKRAVKDSAYRAKASEVYLVEEAMSAAIGAWMPITEPSGNMIVDIGGGTTDIAVISLAGIVYSKAVRVAGNEMDEAIIQYIKKQYNLLIGERTAEQIKIEVGSAFPLEERMTMEIKGRHLIEGVPKTITITDEEIREALAETVNVIVDAVRVALERTPPELSADIVDRGIVLTGGGSLLKNLDKRLREETGLPLAMAEDPLSSVVLGAGKMLSDFNLLRKISID